MQHNRHRVSHHSHHSSLSHFEDLKVLQAELAKQSLLGSADNTQPRTISSAQSTPQVAPKQPLTTIPSRPQSSTRLVPTSWNPVFLDKPPHYKRYLITHPADYPVCALHLAAITIQRWWRRLGRLRRTKRSRRRIEHVPTWQHPWQKLAQTVYLSGEGGVAGRAVASGTVSSRHQHQLMQHAVSFNDYCARLIQRAWRSSRDRRHRRYLRRPMYGVAAKSIQRWWRQRMDAFSTQRSVHEQAAITIQRAYRASADRKIYHFFRQLLLSRQHADPTLLLRTLQSREQSLADSASGLYVRLRLGGTTFPPLIYYKVFTTQHVLDIGSFAPRHYAIDEQRRREARKAKRPYSSGAEEDKSDVSYWYQRWENNGWRVVSGQLLLEHREDEIERSTAAVRSYHHPNKQVRRADAERRRKERKIEWMRKMYARGSEGDGSSQAKQEAKEMMDVYQVTSAMDALIGQTKAERQRLETEAKTAAGVESGEEEEDVDSLVDWASQLCFDDYSDQWRRVGVTRPARRDQSIT